MHVPPHDRCAKPHPEASTADGRAAGRRVGSAARSTAFPFRANTPKVIKPRADLTTFRAALLSQPREQLIASIADYFNNSAKAG
jgi:hypothetical protein